MQKIDPYHHSRFLGYISEVFPAYCKLRFPNKDLLDSFHHSGENYKGGLVGSYIVIAGDNYGFLARISNVFIPEKDQKTYIEDPKSNDFYPVANVELLLSFNYLTRAIDKGLSEYPSVGAKAYACSPSDLAEMLKGSTEGESFAIGCLSDNSQAKLNISVNSLLGRHCAIVGSTGGGKSFTLARIVEEFADHGGKFILIDATGEFEPLKTHKKVKSVSFNFDENSAHFDYSKLTSADFHSLFKPAGQVQAPKLEEAIKSLKLLSFLEKKPNKSVTENKVFGYKHASINVLQKDKKPRSDFLSVFKANNLEQVKDLHFDIQALAHQIWYECVYDSDFDKPENFGGVSQKDQGNVHSLIVRVSSIVNNSEFSRVFDFGNKNRSDLDICNIINNFLSNKEQRVLHISLKHVPDEWSIREILVNALGRFLLEKARKDEFKKSPLVVALDEAHQFLNKKIFDEYSLVTPLDAFEKIAKECRKFGLFVVISTQMPRDIPSGVLSQMGAFIVHRMINEKDRQAIENAASDASKTALSFLPVLMKGEAILTGVEFPMPVILKIAKPKIEPDSKTPEISF